MKVSIGWSATTTHEYEILDKIRDSSVGDDEEPGNGTGHGLLHDVRLPVARLILRSTSASGHQLEKSLALVGRSGGQWTPPPGNRNLLGRTGRRRWANVCGIYVYTGINYNRSYVCCFFFLLG